MGVTTGMAARSFLLLTSGSMMLVASSLTPAMATSEREVPREDMVLCPVRDSLYYDDNTNPINEYFECPGPEDPPGHNRCCEDGCCPTVILDSILNVDIHVAMAISLTVICFCVVTGIVIIICCFVSSCPCYDTLSGGWAKGEPVQNPTHFFNGYAAPPAQNTEEAAANGIPSAGGAKMTNGGGRIKGRRVVNTSAVKNNVVEAPAIVIHPVKVSDAEEV